MQFLILLLFIANLFPNQTDKAVEQIAIDYFFENIFIRDLSDYRTVEFNNQTRTDRSYGGVYNCDQFDEVKAKRIFNNKPEKSVLINADKCPVKARKIKDNSSRLKIEVTSNVEVDGQFYIYITAYKKLHFVEHYIVVLNKTDYKVVDTCHFNEII